MALNGRSHVARIRATGHLSDRDIARATEADVSNIRTWLDGTASPAGESAERLAELSAIVGRLAQVMEPTYIPVWFRKPVAALGGEQPIELLARGDWEQVARLISGLESPGAS